MSILQNILSNFIYYLSYEHLYVFLIGLSIILYSSFLYTRKCSFSNYKILYPYLSSTNTPHKHYYFSLGLYLTSLLYYAYYLFSLDTSLFNNYDLMSVNTTKTLVQGITPFFYTNGRLAPLAFFDLNIIYAFTQNFNIINFYLLSKLLFINYLLFVFLNYLSLSKRFILIALINILPGILWLNNIVYPEYNGIIFIILSLIYLRNFLFSNQSKYLFAFIIFMNFGIYTKESITLIYGGILAYLILFKTFNGEITLS